MQRDASTPQEYIDMVPDEQRDMLQQIRKEIFAAVPGIEEVNEYGMLGYPGLANLAAQKNYVALYVNPKVLAEHKGNFKGVSCGKSCMRFRKPEQIDTDALAKMLAAVAAFNAADGE